MSRTITTNSGSLELVSASPGELRGIARYWPMGLIENVDGDGNYGLEFQQGEIELWGVKLQPVDLPAEDGQTYNHVNRVRIASALPHYLKKNHRGVIVPCAYYKEKSDGKVESGIAIFVGPDAESRENSGRDALGHLEDRLGCGATDMIFDMIEAMSAASKELELPQLPTIGLELRPRLALGGIVMHFAVVGASVVLIKDQLIEGEPIWDFVVKAGFSRLPYAPMRPAAAPDAQSDDPS